MNIYLKKVNLSNPLLIYTFIWTFTLILYTIKFTNNILELNYNTVFLIFMSIVNFSFIYIFFYVIKTYYKKPINKKYFNFRIENLHKVIRKIYLTWFILTSIEIILFKGVPLISVLIYKNYELDYKSFGIPTLHGLLNACYYTILIGNYILYTLSKQKQYLYHLLLLLIWPILVMSRAMLLWGIIEILCVFLILNRINLKKIIKISIVSILFIIAFGIIGDSRNGDLKKFTTSTFVSYEYTHLAEYIPSGFVWVYLYATTPINNIVINIDEIKPSYSFKYSLNGLIPSVIRDKLFDENKKYALKLNDEAFNVSSFFANYLFDFGKYGALVIVGIIQLILIYFYFSALTLKVGSIIAYSALYYANFTSIFFDNFLSLPMIFQIILGLYINYFIYTKNV